MSTIPLHLARRLGPEAATNAGAVLLQSIHDFLGRFVAYPSEHAHVAHTLWIAHAHRMDAWESTPRLAFLSPEPASGKTRALEMTELLVPRAVEAVNVSPAYLFRRVSDPDGSPTILFDEIDAIFGPKAREHEEVRAFINAGHRKGAVAGRCIVRGKEIVTVDLSAYCAVALAGLGNLPDTILSRAVVVRMRRRAPAEHVEPYRRRFHAPEGHRLRDMLARWLEQADFSAAPVMPPGISDRPADVWEALLAVADAAGGDWPERARAAAVAMVQAGSERTTSLGLRLLADIRSVFGTEPAMSTAALLAALVELEDAPWGDLRGRALDSRRLARLLAQYEVAPRTVRIGGATPKGYAREDLADVWPRYLPSALVSATSATSATGEARSGLDVADVADVALPGEGEGDIFDFVEAAN